MGNDEYKSHPPFHTMRHLFLRADLSDTAFTHEVTHNQNPGVNVYNLSMKYGPFKYVKQSDEPNTTQVLSQLCSRGPSALSESNPDWFRYSSAHYYVSYSI